MQLQNESDTKTFLLLTDFMEITGGQTVMAIRIYERERLKRCNLTD